jgi:hypothetical protein
MSTASNKWFTAEDYLSDYTCEFLAETARSSKTQNTSNKFFDDSVVYPHMMNNGRAINYATEVKRKLEQDIKVAYGLEGEVYADTIALCKWPEGKSMTPHRDNQDEFDYSTPWREYAAIIYLNDDYDGGELTLDELGISIKPKKGQCILLEADMLHGVSEVTHGTRYTLISWFNSEKHRGERLDAVLAESLERFNKH